MHKSSKVRVALNSVVKILVSEVPIKSAYTYLELK
jgi:hypothetical protein